MPSDSSYGTDRCTQSSSKSKPIVQYVLMIDAGSTGSRIHVYKFNNCGPTPELEHEEFKMTEWEVGGLSKYKDDADAAAKTLEPLMKVAMDTVPDALKGCSPIAVKATAGLRMIGADPANQGEGHGGALMAYALARCDRDHAPAYLESSNPRNIPFYQRHGFEPLCEIQIGSSPTLVPMLRPPH